MSVPERKKRKSKWDQTTLPGGVKETPSSQDASVSAAAAAARLNAMLEAQGKLNRQMPSSLAQNTSSLSNSLAQASDRAGSNSTGQEGVAPVEIEINDSEARGTLTKGPVLNDINKATGAYISVRGRYMLPEEKANQSQSDQALHLHIQGPNAAFINAAVQKVRTIMNEADYPHLKPPPLATSTLSGGQSNAHHYLQDKVFVGIADAPDDFKLMDKLQGPGGTFLGHIASTTGAKVFLRGRGSGYLEPTSGRESFEALYVYLSHPKPDGLSAARKLCENLIEHIQQEYNNYQRAQYQSGYQPAGFNPYYQNPYGQLQQAPPINPQAPPTYAPAPLPHPQMIPHPFPNQPGLGPHPPPGPLMMPPQPYYDGSGYCPPGYMGPAPPIMQGGGPMGTYLPPPLVGPQKPPLIEQINQDHTPNVQYQAPPPPSLSAPPSSLPPSVSPPPLNTTNLAYHQLPRNKNVTNDDNNAKTKRKFTEVPVTYVNVKKDDTRHVNNASSNTPTGGSISSEKPSARVDAHKSKLVAPPSSMPPPSRPTNKRPLRNAVLSGGQKKAKFLSLVSYGEDSSESDNE